VPRTRINGRLAKLHRSYTTEEAARLLGLHRNTVRGWLRAGQLKPIDTGRPALIQGRTLRAFLETRRDAAKRPCPPGTLYCLKCRQPKAPAMGMADFVVREGGTGNLRAFCEACGSAMHRRTCQGDLDRILPGIEVRFVQAPPRIAESPRPSVKRT
jgi:excisionase family DNA binding protein